LGLGVGVIGRKGARVEEREGEEETLDVIQVG
jgi:hypothetical protein